MKERGRILIIEDSQRWAKTFQDTLSGDFDSTIVSEQDEAFSFLDKEECQAILLDLCLDQNEFNLISRKFLGDLRQRAPHVPIVVATGKTIAATEAFQLRELGVVSFFEKERMGLEELRIAFRGAVGGVGSSCDAPAGQLSPSRKRAYALYRIAIVKVPRLEGGTDEEVYRWIRENLEEEAVPRFQTWARYVRDVRAVRGERKHNPRHGRMGGGSIVHGDEI